LEYLRPQSPPGESLCVKTGSHIIGRQHCSTGRIYGCLCHTTHIYGP